MTTLESVIIVLIAARVLTLLSDRRCESDEGAARAEPTGNPPPVGSSAPNGGRRE